MTVFSFVLLLFLLPASIPLVVRTNVVALLIFLPNILRCFLLNVNNTFEDDDENDVGVGVDVAIQQKKSLEQTPPVLGPSGRGINRAHKKNVHKVTQFLSLSFGDKMTTERKAQTVRRIFLWSGEILVFSLAREKNGFSFECHMCSHFFSTRQTAQKDDVEWGDDASAEKMERGERCVEFDRE